MQYELLKGQITSWFGKCNDSFEILDKTYDEFRLLKGSKSQCDFLIQIKSTDSGRNAHQIKHVEVIKLVEHKKNTLPDKVESFASAISQVYYHGRSPDSFQDSFTDTSFLFLLKLHQLLAIEEDVNYPYCNKKGTGRYLPGRLSVGVLFDLWNHVEIMRSGVLVDGLRGFESLMTSKGKTSIPFDLEVWT